MLMNSIVQSIGIAAGKTLTNLLYGLALLLFLLGMNLTLVGCDKNPMSTDLQQDQPAAVEGRVDESALSKGGAQGATVTVAEVQSDGSLSIVSSAPVQTNLTGYYKIDVSVSGKRNLVVIATKNDVTTKAVVSAEVKRGITVKAPPITAQTTVEAEVYTRLVATGKADLVSIADLRAAIDEFIASDVKGNASFIAELATAIGVEAQARAMAFASSEVGATQEQLENIHRAKIQAVVALDYALHASFGNPQGIQVATQAFFEATVRAHTDNGMDAEKYARARIAALRALIRWSGQLSAETKFKLEKRIALLTAQLIDRVNQAHFQLAGAAQAQLAAVASAGVTLKASVNAATTIQQIVDAFETYHTALLDALTSVYSVHASAIVSVDAQINAESGFKSELRTELAAATSAHQVVTAYQSYYAKVKDAAMNAMPGAVELELRVIVATLLLINMS